MKSEEFFKDRLKNRLKVIDSLTKSDIELLNKSWYTCKKDINVRIKKLLNAYAKKENMTESEARKWLKNEKIVTGYGKSLTRYEEMKKNIQIAIRDQKMREKTIMYDSSYKICSYGYYSTIFDVSDFIGVNLSFSKISKKQIEQLLKNKWKGSDFSSRVWKNGDLTADVLVEELALSILEGKSIKEMAKVIDYRTGVGRYNSERLLRTETNYLYNQSIAETYEELGVERYLFIATLDGRTCGEDGALDGQSFLLSDASVGINYPPMHPNCRCRTVADLNQKMKKRILKKSGTNKKFDYDSYSTWTKELGLTFD